MFSVSLNLTSLYSFSLFPSHFSFLLYFIENVYSVNTIKVSIESLIQTTFKVRRANVPAVMIKFHTYYRNSTAQQINNE